MDDRTDATAFTALIRAAVARNIAGRKTPAKKAARKSATAPAKTAAAKAAKKPAAPAAKKTAKKTGK